MKTILVWLLPTTLAFTPNRMIRSTDCSSSSSSSSMSGRCCLVQGPVGTRVPFLPNTWTALQAKSSVDSIENKKAVAETPHPEKILLDNERGMDRITRLWWQGTRFQKNPHEESNDDDCDMDDQTRCDNNSGKDPKDDDSSFGTRWGH